MLPKAKLLFGGAVALCILTSASSALALTDMTAALKQTQSQSWQTRAAGINAIEAADTTAHPVLADMNVRGRLIALLQRETGFHDSRQRYGERYFDYYTDLLSQVASWKDPRALPVLMDVRVITTGNAATGGVAEFGDAVVAPVVARFKASSDILERVSLLSVLDHIAANRAPLSPANAQMMRTVLLAASRDHDQLIRIGAVRGLVIFRDNFTRDTLKSIAARDPFSGADGKTYLVRDEAARALAAMQSKGPHTAG